MGAVCQCLVRFCCEAQGDDGPLDDADNAVFNPVQERHPHEMNRGDLVYQSAAQQNSNNETIAGDVLTADDEEHGAESGCGCPHDSHTQGIHDFLRRFRQQWGPSDHAGYDIMTATTTITSISTRESDVVPLKSIPAASMSPLRQAHSFDSSRDVPCIHSQEIVMPGSLMQKEMASLMCSKRLTDGDVECVICLEIFDAGNPRMPTLCGCGENKTFFHLPCLYQWLEQSEDCPSCRKKLSWQEFS